MIDKEIQQLHMEKLPDRLYRYCAINGDTLDSLKNNYLWFSQPKSFNDPFDCNSLLMKEPDIRTAINFLLPGIKGGRNERRAFINNLKKRPEVTKQTVMEAFVKTIDNCGICCFSQEENHPLMWAHYADRHKGIMLTFNPQIDQTNLFATKVNYQDEYIPVAYTAEFSKALLSFASIKSKYWEYENEYRAFRLKFREHPFDSKALIKITLGLNIEKPMIDIIKNIKEEHYPHAQIVQAVFGNDKICLVEEEI